MSNIYDAFSYYKSIDNLIVFHAILLNDSNFETFAYII